MPTDPRLISTGHDIPTVSYADQPYITIADDGAWVCIVTTGADHEGKPGQHVVVSRSTDQGQSWSEPVALEPPDGPEASYAVLLKIPGGRIFAFYNHNTDKEPWVKADPDHFQDGKCYRVDSLGYFVFKFSDDHGKTWSEQRYPIPQRLMRIDRENADGGKVLYFWNVGKAFIHDDAAYVPLHKVGGFGDGFFTSSEGVLLRSDNMLTESDPERITWQTLPDGDEGIKAAADCGPIAEEHSFVELSDGSLFVVYRTISGYANCAYSRDHGRSWSQPDLMRYRDGRPMKHPRAANFVWRCENGKYLYWFHNHGGPILGLDPRRRSISYQNRNPVWISGGTEIDGPDGMQLAWSEPEILLYDDDVTVRMSYPDFIEDQGRCYFSETQKTDARVHEVDPQLLQGLWQQGQDDSVSQAGLIAELSRVQSCTAPVLPELRGRNPACPTGPSLDLRAGFSVELFVQAGASVADCVLLEGRHQGPGLAVMLKADGRVIVELNDERTCSHWASEAGVIQAGRNHHLVVLVDGGPKTISFILDGRFLDGGAERQFGFGRYHPQLVHVNGASTWQLADAVQQLRVYDRALRVSEACAHYQASLAVGAT